MPKRRSNNLDELWGQVQAAWREYPEEKLNKIFDTKGLTLGAINLMPQPGTIITLSHTESSNKCTINIEPY
jgi:hypothetical protein